MFKKSNIYILLAVLSLQALYIQASQPAASASQTKAAQVWGTMYIAGNMTYLGKDTGFNVPLNRLRNMLDDKDQPVLYKDNDVVVDVCASSEESKNWSARGCGHPVLGKYTFPCALPISILEGKKEGDSLQFKLRCPESKKMFNVLVLCKGNNNQQFSEQLHFLKEKFANGPLMRRDFTEEEADYLLLKKIIVKNPKHDPKINEEGYSERVPPYLHGPNGIVLASFLTLKALKDVKKAE